MDIKSVNRDHLLRNYVVNVYLLKHANYLNTMATPEKIFRNGSNLVPRENILIKCPASGQIRFVRSAGAGANFSTFIDRF